MKKHTEFLKALGAYIAIALLLAFILVSFIATWFPSVLPDWMYTVLLILDLPFFIGFVVFYFKEWRKAKKEKQNK